MESAEQEFPAIKDNEELLALLAAAEKFTLEGFKGLPDFLDLLTNAITKKWQSFMSMQATIQLAHPEPLLADQLASSASEYIFSIASSDDSDLSIILGCSNQTFLQHVDMALGGDGEEEITKGYEDLTPAEHAVFPQICQIFIDGFCDALSTSCEMPNFLASEAHLYGAVEEWLADKDPVRFNIEVRFGEASKSLVMLVPIQFLEPLKDAIIEVEEEAPPIDFLWVRTLEDMVEQTEIELKVCLGSIQLSIGEINNLTPDTLLDIETDLRCLPVKDEEGRAIFSANLGKDDNFYQLIVSPTRTNNEDGNVAGIA